MGRALVNKTQGYKNGTKKLPYKVKVPENNTADSESTTTDSSGRVQVKYVNNYTQNKEDVDIRDGLKVKHNGRTFATGKTNKPKLDPIDAIGGAPKGVAVAGANLASRAIAKVVSKSGMVAGKKAIKKTLGIDKQEKQKLNDGGLVKKLPKKPKKDEGKGFSFARALVN